MLAGEAKALHTTKRSSGVDVSDPALADAWARVRQDSDPQTDWCAFHHAQVPWTARNYLVVARSTMRLLLDFQSCIHDACIVRQDVMKTTLRFPRT